MVVAIADVLEKTTDEKITAVKKFGSIGGIQKLKSGFSTGIVSNIWHNAVYYCIVN